MKLATLTAKSWATFCSWLPAAIAPPDRAVLVQDDDAQLVLGVCLYQTSSEYMLVARLAANPEADHRTVHKAVAFASAVIDGEAKMSAKVPLVFSSVHTVTKVLQRAGWQKWQGEVMYKPPESPQQEKGDNYQDNVPKNADRRPGREKTGVGSRMSPKTPSQAPISDFEDE